MVEFEVKYDDQVHDSAFSAIKAANEVLRDHGIELNIDFIPGEEDRTDGIMTLFVEILQYGKKEEIRKEGSKETY